MAVNGERVISCWRAVLCFVIPVYNGDMIYSLSGELRHKKGRFIVIGIGGIEYKVTVPINSEVKLPKIGENVAVYTFMHVREGGIDLYGFLNEEEHSFFELLLSVSGIGPKSAMGVLSVAPIDQLTAAVSSGQADLLQKSSGIGKKSAQRIVLELKDIIAPSALKITPRELNLVIK